MARTVITFRVESDPVADLLAAWECVARELPKRHGVSFRDLDRRMSAIVEGEAPVSAPDVHDLGEAMLIVTPPREMVAIVAEARRLGVI
jgi:hypothetical protein